LIDKLKIIFVDIDGPLSWGTWFDGSIRINKNLSIPYPLVEEECKALTEIVNGTGAKLVISSDWRRLFTLAQLRRILEFYGIPKGSVIGVTHQRKTKFSSSNEWDRACQIMDWVEKHKRTIESWIAIDDLSLGRYFADQTEKHPYITSGNHVWIDGDWCDIRAKLHENIEKITSKLNGRTDKE
jgi:hypothetical protein